MYELPESVLDPRAGDVVIARADRGWHVMVVRHLVAVERLLPLGERGDRTYVPESVQHDSEPPTWHDRVLLLVDLHPDVFDSAGAARDAVEAGTLQPPVPDVLIDATSLTAASATVHDQGP